MTSAEIHQRRPGWEIYRDGCPAGESPAQVYQRAGQFVELAVGAGGTVLAFAHGHILRAVAVAWIGLDIIAAEHLRLDVATLSTLLDGDRGRELALWNAP